jgi:hypothetical protein
MKPSPSIEYLQLPHSYIRGYLATGKRLIVIAESEKGALYEPIAVTDALQAKTLFGSGPLVDRFDDVTAGQVEGVYLMRIESNAFQKAYDVLIKFPFDLIYIDGLYFNTHQYEIQSFIEFAKEKEHQGQLIHGFFDVQGLDSMDSLRSIFSYIQDLSKPIEGGIEELGKYLSVVVNQIQDHKAAAVYAGLVTSLNPEISPVNKTLNVKLKWELEKEDILELRDAGLVCFKDSLKKGVVCTSSSCAVATKDSPDKYISNFRIAQYLIQEIAEAQQEYVGRVGVYYTLQEVESILIDILSNYVMLNRIKTFDYEITADPVKGIIYTSIEIVPIFSIYAMTQTTQVRVRQ